MMYNLIILQWLLKRGVELLPPNEEGPGIIIPGPYVYQGNMLLNILNVLRKIDWDLDYDIILEEIFFKKYDHEQKVLMKEITKKYYLQGVVKYKIENEDLDEIILSIGGDPELPLTHENYISAFEDRSCMYAAENRFIRPIYILISEVDCYNVEKVVKAVTEYFIETIKIFKRLVSKIFEYEFGNYNYGEEPYGGHIHIGLRLKEGMNKFEIKEYLLTMFSVIGAVKYDEWFDEERYYNNYYGNALHYRSKNDNISTIRIEFRNPPWWVWNQYKELAQIIAAIIIAVKGLIDERINAKMDQIME